MENVNLKNETANNDKGDVSRRYFLITKVNSYATGVSNIIGITDDEEYAKSRQSVFCAYEEVMFLKK